MITVGAALGTTGSKTMKFPSKASPKASVYGRLLTILDLGCLGGATWPHTPAGSAAGAPGGSPANLLAGPLARSLANLCGPVAV